MQYTEADVSIPGRRQLNAALPLGDFAKLEVMSQALKTTKRRLASDLLGAAVQEAFESLSEKIDMADDMNGVLDVLEQQEEDAQ